MQAQYIHVISYSHLSSVEFVTKRSCELLSDSSTDRAVDRLLDLAGGAGHAHVVLQNVAVHLESELEVWSDLIAACWNTTEALEEQLLALPQHVQSAALGRDRNAKICGAFWSVTCNTVQCYAGRKKRSHILLQRMEMQRWREKAFERMVKYK